MLPYRSITGVGRGCGNLAEGTKPQDSLNVILQRLRETGVVEVSVLATNRGLLLAHSMLGDLEAETVGAMAATLRGSGAKAASSLGLGPTQEVILACDEGLFLIFPFGEFLLAAVVGRRGNLGLATVEMRSAVEEVREVLGLPQLEIAVDEEKVAEVIQEVKSSEFLRSLLGQLGEKS